MSDIYDAALRRSAHIVARAFDPEEITALRAENEKLRTALWDIHALCNNYPHFFWWPVHRIKRRVRAAIAKAEKEGRTAALDELIKTDGGLL